MINERTLQGNWDEIKGKMRIKWEALTDDDVNSFDGDVEQLIGKIAKKTGAPRHSIEQFFGQFEREGVAAGDRASQAVGAYAQHAADSVHESTHQAAIAVRKMFAEYEGMVRERPAESLAVCFGSGMLTGVLIKFLLRRH
jgi:uncharacterized protein YjbJ (UPF0337 family)